MFCCVLPEQQHMHQTKARVFVLMISQLRGWRPVCVLRTLVFAGKGLKPQLCSQTCCRCVLIPQTSKLIARMGAGSSCMGRDTSCGFVLWVTDSSPTLVFCQCYSVNGFWFVLIQGKLQYHIRIHIVALKNFKSRLFHQSSYCADVKTQPNKHRFWTENWELGI